MAYFNLEETKRRVEKVKGILREKNLDCAIIYYDELNVADGWYLTGWCPVSYTHLTLPTKVLV